MSILYTRAIDLLTTTEPAESSAGISATNTPVAVDVSKFQLLGFQFVSKDNTGSGVFTIDGSNDGVHWTTSLAFQDATSTASATWVTSKTLNSAATAAGYLPSCWRYVRGLCTITTGGTYWMFMHAKG